MNASEILKEFARLKLTEGEGMMLLADSNTISDNCITSRDVAEVDVPNAVAWLKQRKPK